MGQRRDRFGGGGGPGRSRFAGRGQSTEERMRQDDSRYRFDDRQEPVGYVEERGVYREPAHRPDRTEPRGYYGSGGSYGYGGSYEHGGPDGYDEREGRQGPGRGDEFYEATGGFGHDAGAYGRHGLGPEARRVYDTPSHPSEPRRSQRAPTPYQGRTPRGYTRADERIRDDVCDRLSHGHFDPSDVSVTVSQGIVTIEGFVESRSEKFHVEEVAASVLGVKDVDNRLRLRGSRTPQRDRPSTAETRPGNNNEKGARDT